MDVSSCTAISSHSAVEQCLTERKTSNTGWNSGSKLWRGLNLIMALFFSLCTYVQLNDPDPYVWVPIYMIPVLLCSIVALKIEYTEHSVWRTVCVIHICCCVLGALYHLALVIELMSGHIYNPLMHEEGRELGGLVIVVLWLSLCRFTSFKRDGSLTSTSITTLLILSTFVGLAPLFTWSLCFINGLDASLSHCNGMFPGMLGGAAHS